MPTKINIRKLLSATYPLLAILIGVLLISLPMGPFQTLDTQLEYNTTQGILRWGYPYLDRFGEPSMESYGDLFNMPPLGFYTQALLFRIVGATLENGVFLVTLFGLSCIVMVYLLGKQLYSRTTGLFAAALFALAPWELILSRAFLIDTQSLFLSLICLYVGILAIRKDSVKLAAVSGIFFALALLTKQFAVFMLVPLLLLYTYQRPKNVKRIIAQLAAFSLPAVFSTFLWYQIIMGKELLYLIHHNDLKDFNFPNVAVTYSFVPDFLVNYGLGLAFCVAVVFSFAVGLLLWRRLPKQVVVSDLVCLATLTFIVGLELYTAVNLNLKAPYTSAVKYIYQALPFFSLAAASLATKSGVLFKSAQKSAKIGKAMLVSVGVVGLVLLSAALIANMYAVQGLATASYMVFRVQPNLDVGYSFYVTNSLNQSSPLLIIQLLGCILVASALLLACRHYFSKLAASRP